VIYLPSAADVVERMLVLARVAKDDMVYDLGCGDGRIVIAAVARHGARGVCVDIDPARIAESRRNAERAGVTERIRFEEGDLFDADLRDATVVTLYLTPALNRKLRPKLYRELHPGTRIVSHNFDMGDWRPDSLVRVAWPSGTTSTIYSWVLPADAAGSWELALAAAGAERGYRVRFEQQFQQLTGTASAGGRPVALDDAHMKGDSVAFTLTDALDGRKVLLRLRGRVAGALMSGTATIEADTAAGTWRAARR
jgi:SAM-dependent methyltransferase